MIRAQLVALLLCTLLPLPGFAQAPSEPPLLPAPAARKEVPPQPGGAAVTPRTQSPLRDWRTPEGGGRKAGRIVLESMGGLVLGAVGTLPAFAAMIPSFACSTCYNKRNVLAAELLGFAGMSLGGALGVRLMGGLLGGEGLFLDTLQGAAIASGVGILAAVALESTPSLGVLPMITFPLVGAVIGYERSNTLERERMAKEAPAMVVLPTLSVRSSGDVVAGFVGRF